jgi:hypothetical protein
MNENRKNWTDFVTDNLIKGRQRDRHVGQEVWHQELGRDQRTHVFEIWYRLPFWQAVPRKVRLFRSRWHNHLDPAINK